MGRWLDQVRVDALKPPGEVPTKPTKGPSVGSVSTLGGDFQKKYAADESPVNTGSGAQEPPLPAPIRAALPVAREAGQEPPEAALRRCIQQACDWQDLEEALGQVQAHFEAGQLSQDQAEGLAAMAGQEAQVLSQQADEAQLGGLFRRRPVHRCRSRLLGEGVLFVADGTQVPADNNLVVYRESELRKLTGKSPAQLQAIHLAKKVFDGEVIEG